MALENERPSSLQALLRQLDEQGITDYRRYQQVRNYLEFKARGPGTIRFPAPSS